MKKLRLFIIKGCKYQFIILLVSSFNLMAQNPIIRGTILGPENIPYEGDTVAVYFRSPYVTVAARNESVMAVTDSAGHFELKLPSYDIPYSMISDVRHRGKYSRIYGYNANIFEKGDSINAIIKLDSSGNFSTIDYSGKGSAKYLAAKKIALLNFEFYSKFGPLYKKYDFSNSENYTLKLQLFTSFIDSLISVKNSIIAESKVDKTMQKILRYETSNFYSNWLFGLLSLQRREFKNDSLTCKLIREEYVKNNNRLKPEFDNAMEICSQYSGYMGNDLSFGLCINSKDGIIDVRDLYNLIKENPSEKLREIMIANLLLGGVGLAQGMNLDEAVLDSLTRDGYKYVENDVNKKLFNSAIRLANNTPVFNGTFYDLKGEEVSLSSFRGKVVFIDLWGWGCGACAKYHQSFHKNAFPYLKDDSNFVYLSISNDKTTERWHQGLKRGIYTSVDYTNLHTGKLGLDHPFTKYYAIESNPFLLLIGKDGKIVTYVLGDPLKDLDLIKKELAKPYNKDIKTSK